MDAATTKLFTELVIIPTIRELAIRRGVHGVTKENLEQFAKDPKKVLTTLKDNIGLRAKVTEDLADAIDNIAGDAVGALVSVFASFTPGGVELDDT